MTSTLQTVRIVDLSGIPRDMAARIRAGQQEAAKVWMACRDELHRCMAERRKWPGPLELHFLTKGRFALHSQSVQMVFRTFLGNVESTREQRKDGNKDIRYPYRDKVFYPLMWPKQAVAIQGNRVILPMGRGRASIVFKEPDWLESPAACKIVWNRTHYEAHFSVELPKPAPVESAIHATVDLGEIHQCAVTTNDGYGLIVSGRGIRSEKRRKNKMHAELSRLLSRCKKGSRRWKRLRKRRNVLAARIERRIRDLRHKGTRQVIEFCKAHNVSRLFVGDPHGVRQRCAGRKHNQRMAQWEYGKDIDYLTHKSAQAGISCFTGSERGTSSRCPRCGHRHKPQGRNWVCARCGFRGHRDLVGSLNMHALAFDERPMFPAAHAITYLRPGTAFNALPVRSSRPDTGHAKGMLPHGAEDLSQPRVSNARRRASDGSKSSESVGSPLL